MNNFWNIVGFEFKKILMKKSAIVAMLLTLGVTILTCAGLVIGNYYVDEEIFETKREGMQKDREYTKALAGRPINSELLLETAKAYQKIPLSEVDYRLTEEYQLYARPYSAISNLMRKLYSTPSNDFSLADIQNLTQEQADAFYEIRYEKILEATQPFNQKSRDKILALNAQIDIPIIFEYEEGYQRFIIQIHIIGLLSTLLIAICLSSIFAKEYSTRTDQLILASKNGKKTLIYAKIFVGFSLATLFSIFMTALIYGCFMLIYGLDGANVPLQVFGITSPYPLTMGQFSVILSIGILFGHLLIASLTMLLSALLKSSFGVIIILSVLIIAPMYMYIPETELFLLNLANLLPSYRMASWHIAAIRFYEVFGLSIEPFIFLPIFTAVVSIVLVPFTFKGFKNHQVV